MLDQVVGEVEVSQLGQGHQEAQSAQELVVGEVHLGQ